MADASVRLEKNQNKNNIKIFEKSKSNTVGVGVPDDPDTKNKHINKPTSNTAITLIALIITIIVLLILAGVTLNMVMGENGIFGKATTAKNSTEIAKYEDELQMYILEIQTDEATNGNNFNMEVLKEKLGVYVQKVQNETVEWTDKESEEPKGVYKKYSFYIDKNYKVHIGKQEEGTSISLEIKSEIPESGYTNKAEDILITITNPRGIKNITKEDGNVIELQKQRTSYSIDYAGVNTNRTYTFLVEDSTGYKETKTVSVTNIDKLPPKTFYATAQLQNGGLKIEANTQDAEATKTSTCSGIDRYEYFVKTKESDEYTKYYEDFIPNFTGEEYWFYVIAYDKAGNQRISIKPDLIANLGVENSLFEIHRGNPQYEGEENGVLLHNSILKTQCPLNSEYTILIETKDIELQPASNHFGMIISYGYGAAYVGSHALGIAEIYNRTLLALSGSGDEYSVEGSFKEWYPSNNWNILAIKYNGSEFSFFINGEKKGSSKSSTNKGSELYIGGCSNPESREVGIEWGYANGYYRNVAVYSQALSDNEILNYKF